MGFKPRVKTPQRTIWLLWAADKIEVLEFAGTEVEAEVARCEIAAERQCIARKFDLGYSAYGAYGHSSAGVVRVYLTKWASPRVRGWRE